MIFDIAVIVALATAATFAFFYAARYEEQRRAAAQPRIARDGDVTPVDRPCLLPANAPLADVLNHLRYTLEQTPRALGDIERTVRLSAERVTDGQVERIAVVFDEHSAVAKHAAYDVRSTKGTT